jgi:hypothetical protein
MQYRDVGGNGTSFGFPVSGNGNGVGCGSTYFDTGFLALAFGFSN